MKCFPVVISPAVLQEIHRTIFDADLNPADAEHCIHWINATVGAQILTTWGKRLFFVLNYTVIYLKNDKQNEQIDK